MRCKACGDEKEENEFPGDRKWRFGRRPTCKACQALKRKLYEKERCAADPEYAERRKARTRTPEYRAWQKRYREGSEDFESRKASVSSSQVKYGVTYEMFERMKADQEGKCAICGLELPLVIDHDHRTGQSRALLCGGCNKGLGFFKDDIGRLANAIGYLSRFLR